MKKQAHKLLGLLVGISISYGALALPSDREQPIRILSDNVTFDELKGVSVYHGNVHYTQGTIKLKADKVTVKNGEEGIEHIKAIGNPASYSELPKDSKEPMVASAKTIEYDATNALVTLTNNAVVEQGKDVFSAPRITYNMDTKVIASKGGRTEIILHPGKGSKKSQAILP